MQQTGREENGREQARNRIEGAEQAVVRAPGTQRHRRKVVGCLLRVYALQLILFGLLAWFVHVNPILPLDVAITRSFQQNSAPWLRITMLVISYPGSSFLLPISRVRWRAFDRQSAPQPPAESPGQPPTPNGESRTHHSGSDGVQFPERSCDGLHRVLGTALRLRRHPLQGKTLVAYCPLEYFGCIRGADWPLPRLPGRPLGQRCPGCLPDKGMVLISRNLRERLFLLIRSITDA